ncbi:MAG: hypothetical protein AB8B85_12555 [Paracoccaceae bacterium]
MPKTFPRNSKPPVAGISLTDPEAQLPLTHALALDNMTITGGKVRSRRGYTVTDTLTAPLNTTGSLASFEINGNSTLIGTSGGEVRTVLPANTLLEAGFTSDAWRWTTQSGNLLGVNGTEFRRYDGTTWATPTLTTGVTAGNLNTYTGPFVGVISHNERVYLWPEDSTTFYYLDAAAVQGEVFQFPLGNLGNVRGKIVEIATWTVNAAHGSNDVLVILTSKGDAVIYEGIDPSDATDWRLMGRYKMPDVLPGGRSTVKRGADLLVMTTEGTISMTSVLRSGDEVAEGDGISPSMPLEAEWADFSTPLRTCTELDGTGQVIVFNAVDETGATRQVIYGQQQGAPTTWSGLDAVAWASFSNGLYFMDAAGRVCQLTGAADNGAEITITYQSGFSDPLGGQNVNVVSVQYKFRTSGTINVSTSLGSDWQENTVLTGPVCFSPDLRGDGTTGTTIDAAMGVAGAGSVFQLRAQFTNGRETLEWMGTKFFMKSQAQGL